MAVSVHGDGNRSGSSLATDEYGARAQRLNSYSGRVRFPRIIKTGKLYSLQRLERRRVRYST